MSDRSAPLPDPPVPGSIIWRGWLTKKGSFIPTLKRRFGTLHIGPDYVVTLDYRETESSSTSKGVFTFTSATTCLEHTSSIGSIPVQQCLIIHLDPSTGSRVYCGFDTVEARQSFHAAVELAVNAKLHAAAFQSRQERAKQIFKESDMKSNQVLLQRGRQEPGHQPGELQQDFFVQRASAEHTDKNSAVEDQELISRLTIEVAEYQHILRGCIAQSQYSNVRTFDSSSRAANRPFSQDSVSILTSVGGQISTEFVHLIGLEQQDHSWQLEQASKYAAR